MCYQVVSSSTGFCGDFKDNQGTFSEQQLLLFRRLQLKLGFFQGIAQASGSMCCASSLLCSIRGHQFGIKCQHFPGAQKKTSPQACWALTLWSCSCSNFWRSSETSSRQLSSGFPRCWGGCFYCSPMFTNGLPMFPERFFDVGPK